jgi:two-component system response regulator DevR
MVNGVAGSGEPRVFLLEDHAIVREGVAALLTDSGIEVVGQAERVEGVLWAIEESGANVAILDISLPDGNGIEVCRDIRAKLPDVRCIMLTSSTAEMALFDSVIAGASGFLLKQISGTDMVAAVHAVAAGQSLIDPSLVGHVFDRLRDSLREPTLSAQVQLTERETQIALLIAEGLTNRQIGQRLFIAEKTVRNNITGLLRKLNMSSRAEVIAKVFRETSNRDMPRSPG